MTAPLVRLSGIHKRFGSVVALGGAHLEVRPGEVHGVLGENGAGKSTLLGVLGGLIRPDAGEIQVGGVRCTLASPRDAWAVGVGMVHQHFTLVPAFTVLENLALGRRGAGGGRGRAALAGEVERLMERTGLRVPLEAPVASLGVGSRQRVEILRTLLREPRVLVLDEPTAVLAPPEVDALFALVREVAASGRSVILVAHKLDEILSVADRVTVLRGGETVLASAPRAEVDVPRLVRAMVGAAVADGAAVGHLAETAPPRAAERQREVVAEVREVRVRGARGEWSVDAVTLEVERGELVGIAGVEGNGQRELALLLAGIVPPDEGEVRLPDHVAFIPQDRTREGLVADFDLSENLALASLRDPAYARGPFLRWGPLRRRATDLIRRFDVRAEGPWVRAGTLSGGNQQRLLLARELSSPRDLVVAENPTRGLDVGAAAFVHRELVRLVGEVGGPGVVLISTDLDEVLALAHRVLVMTRGRLVPVPRDEATREGVGRYMLARGHA